MRGIFFEPKLNSVVLLSNFKIITSPFTMSKAKILIAKSAKIARNFINFPKFVIFHQFFVKN